MLTALFCWKFQQKRGGETRIHVEQSAGKLQEVDTRLGTFCLFAVLSSVLLNGFAHAFH